MNLGSNIACLRKNKKLTQEQFAEKMNVSRQTVSRWESDDVTPEITKLVDMSNFFDCKLDALIKEDLADQNGIYSAITIEKVPAFTMAMYVIISASPEDDVQNYLRSWGARSGLLAFNPQAKMIGWDFPFVSLEQSTRFNLHGYVAAYILPEGFKTDVPGVKFQKNREANYAKITVKDPFSRPFETIPNGYKRIMKYLQKNHFKENPQEDIIGCFEYEYDVDGIHYMDIYIHADSVE